MRSGGWRNRGTVDLESEEKEGVRESEGRNGMDRQWDFGRRSGGRDDMIGR